MQSLMRSLERLMAMNTAAWRRHANPWSGLTRFSALPLLALAIWSRVWIGGWAWLCIALALAWVWANPRVFAEPKDWGHWMSRGVMGERIFIDHFDQIPERHRLAGRRLALASAPGVLVLGYGLWALWLDWTIAGILLTVLPKVWFVDRMVWLYGDWRAMGHHAPGFEDVEWERPR